MSETIKLVTRFCRKLNFNTRKKMNDVTHFLHNFLEMGMFWLEKIPTLGNKWWFIFYSAKLNWLIVFFEYTLSLGKEVLPSIDLKQNFFPTIFWNFFEKEISFFLISQFLMGYFFVNFVQNWVDVFANKIGKVLIICQTNMKW